MIEKIKWTGWLIAVCMVLLILVQRCRVSKNFKGIATMHDTIVVHGDSELYMVQDTVLKPYKVYYPSSIYKVDSDKIIKDYFAGRVYHDTIKARDITAVIEDSISTNKIEGHKVLFENSRDMHLITPEPKPIDKLFAGGFIGYSTKNMLPGVGISFSLINRKDIMYSYGYDVLNRTHTIGLCWKIHFPKFWQVH